MPKRIALLRHAKSAYDDPSLADHDRPLNERGERDAPVMARRLIESGGRPSMILTSTARRTRQTVRIFAREIGYPIEFIQGEPDLYLASPRSILDVIERQDVRFNEIIVCGHNPGITHLANELCGTQIDDVPTCGLVIIEADISNWTELDGATCTLVDFDYPKKERAAARKNATK
jgi:phosphohistidine phosphatase